MDVDTYLQLHEHEIPEGIKERIEMTRKDLVVYEKTSYALLDNTTGELIHEVSDTNYKES